MNSYRKFLPGVMAALVGLVTLGVTNQARANLQIALSEDGGARTVVATATSFTAASFIGGFGDFQVNVFGGSSDMSASLSDILSSVTSVKNNSTSTHTLHLWVSQDGYNLPVGPSLKAESGLAVTQNITGLTLTNIFQAFADKNNNLFGTSDFSNGLQTAVANGSTADTGSAIGVFTRAAGDFSTTLEINFELSGGSSSNYSAHLNLTPTPAPPGLVLAASGVPVLALGWLRRRKVKTIA